MPERDDPPRQPSPSSETRLARSAAISSLAVMGSRMMGLVREQAFAFFFGASREYDAFLTAFRIPNLLRDLLAEGALSAAFVSVFVREMRGHGKQRAFALANKVVNALVLLLIGLVALGMVWAPEVVNLMAVGFDHDKAALATQLTRIMFPYILLVAVAAVAMGMLNAQEYYAVPQSASTFFNITSIAVGLASATALAPDFMLGMWNHTEAAWHSVQAGHAMMGMAFGTLCGGLAQCVMQLPTLYRTGYRWRFGVNFSDPAFRAVLRLMGPAVIGAAAVQLNVFVNSNFASLLGDKPISWLNYAFRLMQFPIGVFGVAVMTAALPALSRTVFDGDHAAFGRTLTRSLELVMVLTVPSMVGLMVLGEPIMRLIYEHGRFTPHDTHATAMALSAYAVGLPGYAAVKLVQPAYVALGDAKTPMVTSLVAVAVNAGLNYAFVRILLFGHVGLALSTSLLATLNVAVLIVILERRRRTLARRRLAGQVTRIFLASVAMGAGASIAYERLQMAGLRTGSTAAGLELLVILPLSLGIYVFAARRLGVDALSEALDAFRRRLARRRAAK